jgi:hypothetical protein
MLISRFGPFTQLQVESVCPLFFNPGARFSRMSLYYYASSAESMGAFRHRKVAEIVQQGQFCDFRGPKTVRFSRYRFHVDVEPCHGAGRKFASSTKPV